MKKSVLVFLFILSSPLVSLSQELLGKWTGMLHQKVNGDFFLELNILQVNGNEYTGLVSSTAVSGPFRGKMTGRVTLTKLSDGTISYQDRSIVDSTKQSNFYWCLKQATLKVSKSADSVEISGDWSSPSSSCPPGTMKLKQALKKPQVVLAAAAEKDLTPPVRMPPPQAAAVVNEGGSERVRGLSMKLVLWDFDAIDEDSVSLKLNGKQVGPKKIALQAFRGYGEARSAYELLLVKGDNSLEITAMNEGLRPGNTVALLVTDEETAQRFFLNLKAKETAVLHFSRM